MARPLLLDAFCGAGGCARGYTEAGFDVVGVDIKYQPRYLLSGAVEFHQGDALAFIREHGAEFDVIHASPPCQAYSATSNSWNARKDHPKLVDPTREALVASGRPYVIENVVGAPLNTVITLCGQMFGLRLYRHRRFESSLMLFQPHHSPHLTSCAKQGRRVVGDQYISVVGLRHQAKENWPIAAGAMGIDWMSPEELSQAIPPAYTNFIGAQLLGAIERRAVA